MSKIKRLFSFAAGVMAAMLITVPVFASGTIAVVKEDQSAAHTYTAYQLLSGTNLGDSVLWDIKISDDIPDTLWDEMEINEEERAATDIAHWIADSIEADTDGSFAVKLARAVLADEEIQPDAQFRSGEEIVLDDGYYLVTSDDAQPMLVLIGNDEVLTINEKSSVPTMDKEIGEVDIEDIVVYGDAADTGIGKVVPYHINGTLPSNYDVYDEYTYKFCDVFDPCLVIDKNSITVHVMNSEGTPVKNITSYAGIDVTDTTMEVSFSNLKEAYTAYTEGDTLQVYYEVMITDNASVGYDPNENYAWIEYTRSPTCEKLGKSEPDRCRLYTWELDLNKIASDTKEALAGAEFVITDAKGRYINTDGTISDSLVAASVWITDSKGHFEVVEVDSGVYTVTETKAPEGYQILPAFTVTIEADYEDENNVSLTATSTGNKTQITSVDAKSGITIVEVKNIPDNPPPKTGDDSNIGLYVILMLAAFAGLTAASLVLIAKRKRPGKR